MVIAGMAGCSEEMRPAPVVPSAQIRSATGWLQSSEHAKFGLPVANQKKRKREDVMIHHCGLHHHHHHGPSRRQMLAMLSAAGASAVGLRYALAQNGEWSVDTHHHIYPPRYVEANLQRL